MLGGLLVNKPMINVFLNDVGRCDFIISAFAIFQHFILTGSKLPTIARSLFYIIRKNCSGIIPLSEDESGYFPEHNLIELNVGILKCTKLVYNV